MFKVIENNRGNNSIYFDNYNFRHYEQIKIIVILFGVVLKKRNAV